MSKLKLAVCPGSYDPITVGHLDIIKRASNLFDKVIVLLTVNKSKKTFFTEEERLKFIKISVKNLKNVQVDCSNDMLADYVKIVNACAVVKGLRAVSDFDYEFQMALANKSINKDVETIFLTSDINNLYLSSGLVREIGSFGRDIQGLVPQQIQNDVLKKLKEGIR